jgi:hypothetical protein
MYGHACGETKLMGGATWARSRRDAANWCRSAAPHNLPKIGRLQTTVRPGLRHSCGAGRGRCRSWRAALGDGAPPNRGNPCSIALSNWDGLRILVFAWECLPSD